jgi:NodT family efflux transporter outer membrane factor (OMF) lipoprotein
MNYKNNTLKITFGLGIVGFLLSSCAIIPETEESLKLHTSQDYETKISLSSKEIIPWPSAQWWLYYEDPQLSALIEEGLRNSSTVGIAKARIDAAKSIMEQSGADLYPNVNLAGDYSNLRQSYNMGMPVPEGFNDIAGMSFNLGYQLDFWGKNKDALAAVTSDAKAAELEKQQTELILSAAIATTYTQLAALYSDLDLVKEKLAIHQEIKDMMELRQQQGLENNIAFEQSHTVVNITKNEVLAIQERIDLTKNELSALIGAGPDRSFEISRPDMKKLTPKGLPINLPAELLGRRADIVAARYRVEAALKKIDVAEKAFYPNINLIGYAGHQALGLDNFASSSSLFASVGPTVSLPIFDGGILRGQYRMSKANYDLAVATYNATLENALHEVSDVITSRKALVERFNAAKEQVESTKLIYDSARNRYENELCSFIDVLRAKDVFYSNKRAFAALNSRAFMLDVALLKALGGGFQTQNNNQQH